MKKIKKINKGLFNKYLNPDIERFEERIKLTNEKLEEVIRLEVKRLKERINLTNEKLGETISSEAKRVEKRINLFRKEMRFSLLLYFLLSLVIIASQDTVSTMLSKVIGGIFNIK